MSCLPGGGLCQQLPELVNVAKDQRRRHHGLTNFGVPQTAGVSEPAGRSSGF